MVLSKLVLKGDVDTFYSKKIHEELSRVMEYPKFEFSEEEKSSFIEIVLSKSFLIDPPVNIGAVPNPKQESSVDRKKNSRI